MNSFVMADCNSSNYCHNHNPYYHKTAKQSEMRSGVCDVKPLTPNKHYRGRTAPLTSKRCTLYIYSTNIGTEYFKHVIYSQFFPSKCSLFHNSNEFGSGIIHILFTGCAKIKKNNSGAKRLILKTGNDSLERVEEFKNLGTTSTNQYSIQEGIKSTLNSGNVCYHSVHNLVSPV